MTVNAKYVLNYVIQQDVLDLNKWILKVITNCATFPKMSYKCTTEMEMNHKKMQTNSASFPDL